MAPKLPPPAKTKAVFAGPAWLDRDKAPGAPRSRGERPRDARRRYSSRKRGDAINIGCDNRHSGMVRRTRPQMCNCTSGNLEIPRCAIAHLRFASSTRPGITAKALLRLLPPAPPKPALLAEHVPEPPPP